MTKDNITNKSIHTKLCGNIQEYDKNISLHLSNTSMYARIIAEVYALQNTACTITDTYIDAIEAAAIVHDIGKLLIPGEILKKSGKLTGAEYLLMQGHAEIGAQILESEFSHRDEFANVCIETARYHHERWDGTGYPEKLVTDDIPLHAQVVSIADIYDALTCERVYKQAFSHEKACQIICNDEFRRFSPRILKTFESCQHMLKKSRMHQKIKY